MSHQFDPVTLRYFLAVVEEGSMAKAAERENISTPAISRRIAELESQLGIPLLDRFSTGVKPTYAGLSLEADSRKILEAIESAQNKLAELKKGVRGKVRLSANPSSVAGRLLEDIQIFCAKHPAVHVKLDEQRSAQVVQAVIGGKSDIGISMSASDAGSLDVWSYRTISLVLVVPVNHQLVDRQSIAFSKTTEFNFVTYPDSSTVGAVVASAAKKCGIPIKSSVEATTQEGMRRLVELGMGVALMTEESAVPYSNFRAIRCIHITDDWARLPTYICTRRAETLSPSARLLLSQLLPVAD